jgi:hypothetical protein
MALRKKEGKAVNGEPGYGFRMIGRRGRRKKVPDPEERRVMAALVRWRREGYTFEEIYRHLREYKVKTRAGREWSLKRIQRAYLAAVRTGTAAAVLDPGEGQDGPVNRDEVPNGTGQSGGLPAI